MCSMFSITQLAGTDYLQAYLQAQHSLTMAALVGVSIALINTMTRNNTGRKGFI